MIDQLLFEARRQIELGKLERAEKILGRITKLDPFCADGHHLLGLVKLKGGHRDQAVKRISRALELQPHNASYLGNLGLAYVQLQKFEAAEDYLSRALSYDANHLSSYLNRANLFKRLGRVSEARQDFSKALELDPYHLDCLTSYATFLASIGEVHQAIEFFDRALAIEPGYLPALNNKGLLQAQLGKPDLALECFSDAIARDPGYVEAYVNKGNLLQKESRYQEALPCYQAALRLHPSLDFVPGHIAICKAMLCDWSDHEKDWSRIEKLTEKGHVACTPFAFLTGSNRADLALELAAKFSERYVGEIPLPWMGRSVEHTRLKRRIGYLSSDFRDHPMSYLMVGVMENHDREEFEWIGISIGPPGDDPLARRILRTFDQFVDVSSISDSDAVMHIRNLELDIAVDLNGYIEGCRPAIFKARIAPVQVSYYGFPGTSGAKFIDYIIGDRFLMPEGYDRYYSEKIIYLDGSYQPNDDRREISRVGKSRQDYGLPQSGFVFCCLNKTYKITPTMFECWMRILACVPSSVLWLFATDNQAQNNLRSHAQREGIDPARIIFTGRVPEVADHLARYCLADLFLDTFPYTAHTTANDALWVGLPVLTLSGQTFSARVGESLLGALGLSHWVTVSMDEYEAKALVLATDSQELDRFRQELLVAKQKSALYKPDKIAWMLEQAYSLIHERAKAFMPPEQIVIDLPD